jgi:hypothetical protein
MTVSINGDGILTFADNSKQSSAAFIQFRNRIINGDLRIDQRYAGASILFSNGGGYLCDRFYIHAQGGGGTGTVNGQQIAADPVTGFDKALRVTVTNAKVPAAGDLYFVSQRVEGFNIADARWGTAQARPITLQFWVKASIAGTYSAAFLNASGTRSYIATYTVAQANVPQLVILTVPGDTAGSWQINNGVGVFVDWDYGSGSSSNAPAANAWQAGNYLRTAGCVNLISTLNATFEITGVQLECGSAATPFEYRPLGLELALCQRYYEKSDGWCLWSGYVAALNIQMYYSLPFRVTKRAAPSLTAGDVANNGFAAGVPGFSSITDNGCYASKVSSAAASGGYFQFTWAASAEL